ncbi:MAG: hypothetical protein ACEPOZ_10380 [Marinifilaceae bacterium]
MMARPAVFVDLNAVDSTLLRSNKLSVAVFSRLGQNVAERPSILN